MTDGPLTHDEAVALVRDRQTGKDAFAAEMLDRRIGAFGGVTFDMTGAHEPRSASGHWNAEDLDEWAERAGLQFPWTHLVTPAITARPGDLVVAVDAKHALLEQLAHRDDRETLAYTFELRAADGTITPIPEPLRAVRQTGGPKSMETLWARVSEETGRLLDGTETEVQGPYAEAVAAHAAWVKGTGERFAQIEPWIKDLAEREPEMAEAMIQGPSDLWELFSLAAAFGYATAAADLRVAVAGGATVPPTGAALVRINFAKGARAVGRSVQAQRDLLAGWGGEAQRLFFGAFPDGQGAPTSNVQRAQWIVDCWKTVKPPAPKSVRHVERKLRALGLHTDQLSTT